MAADHCRTQPASVRKKRNDARRWQGAGGPEAVSRGHLGGWPCDRASPALRHLQLAQSVGPPARDSRGAAANLSQLVYRAQEPTVTSRDTILAAVRANQPTPVPPLPEIPLFEMSSRSLLEQFRESLIRMGGKFAERPNGDDPDRFIRSLFPQAQVICSATPEVVGTRALSSEGKPADLADVDIGVVRAGFGVAETGSIWLSEQELRVNALAYLAQHLIALLDPGDIVGNLHHAYRDPRFKMARYAVLVTGPSATADIEGFLIHGAQGVRSLTVLLVSRPAA